MIDTKLDNMNIDNNYTSFIQQSYFGSKVASGWGLLIFITTSNIWATQIVISVKGISFRNKNNTDTWSNWITLVTKS